MLAAQTALLLCRNLERCARMVPRCPLIPSFSPEGEKGRARQSARQTDGFYKATVMSAVSLTGDRGFAKPKFG
jgi:hypothetical protein